MAIPSAVTRRKEKDEEALRQQGLDPNGAPIDVQTNATFSPPPPTPSPTADPGSTETPEALRARIAELEGLLQTQNGRASANSREVEDLKRQLAAVNDNRSFLETKLTELTSQVEDLRTKAETQSSTAVASVASSLDESGPTAQQMEAFGPESVDFVERVLKRTLASVIKPVVSRLGEIEKQLGAVKEINAKIPQLESGATVAHLNEARMRELEFLRKEIIPYFKDFEEVRETQEWRDYLAQDVPGRGYKVGQLLQSYRKTADAIGLRTLIGAYYEQRKSKSSQSLDSLAVPAKTGADAPPKPVTPKMKASEYKQNLRDFTSKRMPKAEWEAYRTRWDQAVASGQVEMDVELR